MYETMAFAMPGGMELVILLVIVLVIFGGGKLAGVGRSLGQGISEFKNAVKTPDPEKNPTPGGETPNTPSTPS
jgi:sec-independent protein translocase protein TatA